MPNNHPPKFSAQTASEEFEHRLKARLAFAFVYMDHLVSELSTQPDLVLAQTTYDPYPAPIVNTTMSSSAALKNDEEQTSPLLVVGGQHYEGCWACGCWLCNFFCC